MTPIFIGPRQMTASSPPPSRRPRLMTRKPGATSNGWSVSPSDTARRPTRPRSVGTLGPWKSTSSRPVLRPCRASPMASEAAMVLLPTPPLPLMTAMTRRMRRRFSLRRRSVSLRGSASHVPPRWLCSVSIISPCWCSFAPLPMPFDVGFGGLGEPPFLECRHGLANRPRRPEEDLDAGRRQDAERLRPAVGAWFKAPGAAGG